MKDEPGFWIALVLAFLAGFMSRVIGNYIWEWNAYAGMGTMMEGQRAFFFVGIMFFALVCLMLGLLIRDLLGDPK